jgi:membrane fusion protein (multidrug efflux system)
MAQQSIPTSTIGPSVAASKPQASRRWAIFGAVGAVLAVLGVLYWLHARRFEETDDAQIDGNISNVSPRVSGPILATHVVENQVVKQGDLLAEIDPTDLKIAVLQAQAQVAQAQAQLDAEDPSVPITAASNESALASAQSDLAGAQAALGAARKEVAQLTAQLTQAEANDRTTQLDKDRAQKLIAEGAIAQSDFDNHVNAAAASTANLDALRQSLAAARDRVSQQQATIVSLQSHFSEVKTNAPRQIATRKASVSWRQASLDLAKAQLAQAETNLGYAKILAPVSGVIAKKAVAVGDHVAPGQQLFAISQADSLWVTANYRETQLERMQPGQPASVHVDALGLELHGAIESVGGATGSRLSVLPPENATGNYVKVVQRIPVRIRFDPDQNGLDRLRIGMSVEPQVTVR